MSAILEAREADARYLDAPQPDVTRQFDLLAQALNGLTKLRELILSNATSGRLISQGNDFVEWRSLTLGDIGDWGSGGTPSRSHPEYYSGGTIPWLVIGDLTDGVVESAATWITDAGLANSSAKLIEPGTILIAMYGSIGKLGVAAIRCATNQAIAFCRPDLRLVRTDYLFLLLRSMRVTLVERGQGLAQQNISQKILKAIEIRLPPVPIQARIVARVDELMRLCDALEAKGRLEAEQHARLLSTLLGTLTNSRSPEELAENWQHVAAHFDMLLDRPEAVDALEQSIIQLAVRGLLVPQQVGDEPASKLLARIRSEFVARQRVPGDAGVCGAFDLPGSWEWVRIDTLGDVQGGIQKTPLRKPLKNHYPYLRVANVQRDELDLRELERFEVNEEELAKWRLRSGDILIVEGNGSDKEIGRCAVWKGEIDPCLYQNHLIRIRCLEVACVDFIRLFLNSTPGRAEMRKLAITTSGLFNLSVGKIRSIAVPIPPLPEQRRIVARVAQLRRLCADLRERLAASQATQARLAGALVESAIAT